MRFFCSSLFFCFFFLGLSAQHSVRSTVVSKSTDQVVEMATVRLLAVKDSSLITGVQTDMEGRFVLQSVLAGEYLLKVSSIGFVEYNLPLKVVKDTVLATIRLGDDVQLLSELEVVGVATQMQVKGDTLEYNATTFKTSENAVVEELLGKMPGVEITSDGKIYVNGEEVKKIRIDGKKFFGGDLQMATKNIPAEMIAKVQVMDENSEMAKLTGFKGDDDTKIINLTLKPDKKKGYFGNHTAGYGLDLQQQGGVDPNRYESRYDLNSFNNFMLGESQTSLVLGGNNANNSRSAKGRSNITANNGITTTQNLGLNTNVKIGDEWKILGEVTGNHSNNVNTRTSHKKSYSNNKYFNNYDDWKGETDNYNLDARMEVEWRPDSLNTIIIQPTFGYAYTSNYGVNDYDYFRDSVQTTKGNSFSDRMNATLKGGVSLIYSRKFQKKGRSFTVRGSFAGSDSWSEALNQSERTVLSSGKRTVVDQQIRNTSSSESYNLRVSYVEPIYADKHFLEVAANVQYNNRTSEKAQYQFDSIGTNDYTIYDSVYSNVYSSRFLSERMELNYRLRDKRYYLMLGARANPSQTFSRTVYGDLTEREIVNKVWNFAPTAYFRYFFARKQYLRVDYRGTTQQPSIAQLDPTKNNANPMLEQVGNPELNPAFVQYFKILYNRYNSKRFSSFAVSFNGRVTKDALVQNTIFDETGKQYRQTINAEAMPYSLNGDVMYNTPIVPKFLHFNTSTTVNYNQLVGYTIKDLPEAETDSLFAINQLPIGNLSTNRNFRVMEKLSLNFTHEVVELGAYGNFSYSHTSNNLTEEVSDTYDWSVIGRVQVKLPWKMSIGSDLTYVSRYGYEGLDDPDELIWNMSLDQQCFKRKGVFTLRVFDILSQRKNIRQVIGDNFIRYDTYNTLPTYAMLTFAYRPTKIGGKKEKSPKKHTL